MPELQLRQLSWQTYTRGKRHLWQHGLRTGDLGLYGNFWMQQGYTCLWMIRGTHFAEASVIMGLPIPTHHSTHHSNSLEVLAAVVTSVCGF